MQPRQMQRENKTFQKHGSTSQPVFTFADFVFSDFSTPELLGHRMNPDNAPAPTRMLETARNRTAKSPRLPIYCSLISASVLDRRCCRRASSAVCVR